MANMVRFYGSCGHITNDLITLEQLENLAKERLVKTIAGDVMAKNEVTVEGDVTIVHVHPDRFCICGDCMRKEFDNA